MAAVLGADITLDTAENVAEELKAAKDKKADVVILCTSAMSAVDQAWARDCGMQNWGKEDFRNRKK